MEAASGNCCFSKAAKVDGTSCGAASAGRDGHSTLAYQGHGLGAPRELVWRLIELLSSAGPDDHAGDLGVRSGRLRRRELRQTATSRRRPEFHARVRSAYLTIAESDRVGHAIIDADLDELEVIKSGWPRSGANAQAVATVSSGSRGP